MLRECRKCGNTAATKEFAIVFKVKPFPIRQGIEADAVVRMAIPLKKKLARSDTNMRAQDHDYFNSDMFVGILNRKYRSIVGEYREYVYLDEALPAGMSVDTSKFLAVVQIQLAKNFR